MITAEIREPNGILHGQVNFKVSPNAFDGYQTDVCYVWHDQHYSCRYPGAMDKESMKVEIARIIKARSRSNAMP